MKVIKYLLIVIEYKGVMYFVNINVWKRLEVCFWNIESMILFCEISDGILILVCDK